MRYLMKADSIVGYTFRAETLCPACTVKEVVPPDLAELGSTEMVLNFAAEQIGVNREDEHSFDSDDFPKVIFSVDIDDEPCDRCSHWLISGEEV